MVPTKAGHTRPPRIAAGGSWWNRAVSTTGMVSATCTTSAVMNTRRAR